MTLLSLISKHKVRTVKVRMGSALNAADNVVKKVFCISTVLKLDTKQKKVHAETDKGLYRGGCTKALKWNGCVLC